MEDDNVSGMSVITVESTSPASVRSVDSSLDETGDSEVDIDGTDADAEDAAAGKQVPSDTECPNLDVVEEACTVSKSPGRSYEVANNTDQSDSSPVKFTPPESGEDSPIGVKDTAPFPAAESTDNGGMKLASENNVTEESGIILLMPDFYYRNIFYLSKIVEVVIFKVL